jgi:hypothetical protein
MEEEAQNGRGRYVFIGILVGVLLGGNLGILIGHPLPVGLAAGVAGGLVPVVYEREVFGHRLL